MNFQHHNFIDRQPDILHLGLNGNSQNGFSDYPSSSSNPYPDFHHQHQFSNNRQQQHVQPMSQQNSWVDMQRQNISQHAHPHHQQHFNDWSNNQQHQNFSNGLNSMQGFGGMNYLPPQVVQDALVLSSPVRLQDEPLLIQTLVQACHTNTTYREALNGLHGRNQHSATLWKDYYLEHKHRIDKKIVSLLPSPAVPRGLSHDSFRAEPSPPLPSPASAPPKRKARPATKSRLTESPPPPVPMPPNRRRSTINSLTTHTPAFDHNLPPPNADIKIPIPPSRSPTPPTKVVSHNGRGNKFTSEDKDFFLKFISFRLKEDPALSRNDLCELLAVKAPHHSVQSWYSYWSSNHDVPDKILAAAHGEEEGVDEDEDSSEEERIVVRKRPRYKEASTDDEEDEEEDADADADDDEDYEEEDMKIPAFDESAMGVKGGPFTEADFAILSRHVASISNFEDASFQERWPSFSERYPQRSAKSWAEYYRRNERRVLKLANSIRKQGEDTIPTPSRPRRR